MVTQDVFDVLQHEDTNYAAIALHALKRLPVALRGMLRESGELDDVISWALVAAVEGYQEGGVSKRRITRPNVISTRR